MSSSETKVVGGEQAKSEQRPALVLRIVDWFTLRKALAQSRSEGDPSQQEWERAKELVRVADGLLDPPDGTARSSEVAMVLFREAGHWLLRATGPKSGEHQLLSDALSSARELAAPPTAEWLSAHPLPRAMTASRSEFAGYLPDTQLEEARASQRWLHALLPILTAKHDAVVRLKLKRARRLGPVLAALVLLVPLGVRVYRGPDLAAGKPWRTSSTAYTCNPQQGVCGGSSTEILFHTNEESEPWFEVDLLTSQQIGHVEVRNRTDSGQARAVPLVLELSSDGKKYQPVAQTTEEFDTWTPDFPQQAARYVRLRVSRVSILHLERVTVRR